MKILAIDTSTEVLALCAESGGARISLTLRRGLRHSPALLPLADRLLAELGIAPRELELLVCSLGPGSFTGIRIALATAKGISFSTGCPLVGVSTLESLALPWDAFAGEVWPVIDARKGNWYAARFRGGRRDTDYLDLPPAGLRDLVELPALLVGPDAARARSLIWDGDSGDGPKVSDLFDPAAMLRVGTERFAREGPTKDLTPLYLRASEAEIAGEGRHDGH